MLKINNLLNKTTFVLTVALRFFIGIRKNLYSTYITVVAIFALGLGVSIVTVVLGAINGFENEISKNTIQISGHAILFPKSTKADWRNNRDILENQKAVESISSFIRTEALISYGIKTVPVSFEGISTDSNKEFFSQKFNFLKKNKSHSLGVDVVFLGNQLAERLGVKVGEQVTILIPQLKPQKSPEIISVSVKIGDIFSVGLYDIDSKLVLTSLETAARILKESKQSVGFRLTYKDARNSRAETQNLLKTLKGEFEGIDWTAYNRNFFLALKSQKRILFIILSLVIAVAAFNITASILLVVEEKKADIKILRTFGCSKHLISSIFLALGVLISLVGALLGLLLAFGLAYSINPAINFIEWVFSINLLDPAVYYIDYLPISIHKMDLLITVLTTSLLCLIASIAPAYRTAVRGFVKVDGDPTS